MLTGSAVDPRLDPTLVVPQQWDLIRVLVNDSFLMTALIIVAMAALLLAHGMIPSLVASHDAPPGIARLRPVFYALFVVALGFGLYAMARTFELSVIFLHDFYPRFGY